MYEWLQDMSYFYFYFWDAIIHTNERLQVIFCFCFYFLACQRSYVWTIASHFIFWFWFLACHHSYVWTIASYHLIYPIFWSADICMCERLWVRFVQILITGMQSFAHTNDCKSFKQIQNNSGVPPFVCANNCKSYLFRILISGVQSFTHTNDCKSFLKNPKHFWHATVRMCKQLQVIFVADFDFWRAIVCMCERLQVIIFDFIFWCANIRMCQVKSYFYFYFWCAIVHIYERLQIMFWFWFHFLACHHSYVQTIASCNLFWILFSGVPTFICVKSCHILISRVQLFAYTNDCRSCFDLIFWHAIVCMRKRLQVVICFGFYFLVCNHLYVRAIASHVCFGFCSGMQLFVCANDCKS